jgi:cell division protein FtsL
VYSHPRRSNNESEAKETQNIDQKLKKLTRNEKSSTSAIIMLFAL